MSDSHPFPLVDTNPTRTPSGDTTEPLDTVGYIDEATVLAQLPLVRPERDTAPCDQCRHRTTTIRYCGGDPDHASFRTGDTLDCAETLRHEHFHVTCDRCGAQRLERTWTSIPSALRDLNVERAEWPSPTAELLAEFAAAEAILQHAAAADALLAKPTVTNVGRA